MQREQLLLRPIPAFLEVLIEPPARVKRCRPRRRPAGKRTASARPTRWIPGTAPVVHLPMAGTRRPRRYRSGHKPGSIGAGKLTRAERDELTLLEWELRAEGVRFGPPPNFGDCEPGPCPHVSCSMHLYLDVIPSRRRGAPPVIKLNFPGMEVDEIPETCALRAAGVGGVTQEVVGRRLNLTMGRADQLEKRAVAKCAAVANAEGWGEDWRGILARS